MAPLAGRPPYATDDNDSFYEAPEPTRRLRKTPPEDPNKRTTAYDVYDNYLSADNESSRHSGINGVGAGLLAMDEDDEDGSESESISKPKSSSPLASKNAALAVATGAPLPPILRTGNQHQLNIAAPRPGYAAPITALNNIPEPAAVPTGRRPSDGNKAQNPFIRPSIEGPFNPRSPPAVRAQYTTAPPPPPLPPSPHPLQPPITPITPVFARPAKPTGISFAEKPKVTRTERTVLPARGEKGDDFWKRFSMVAKEPSAAKESNWLKETRSGYSSLSRWVWCVGITLLICGVGAIGIWLYVAHKNVNHSTPTAVGGSADEAATFTSTSTALASTGSGKKPHVSPTNTVARRDIPEPTGAHNTGSIHHRHANRMMDVLF